MKLIINYMLISFTAIGMLSCASSPFKEKFTLPDPKSPPGNEATEARIELGKALFFDPRLSKHGNMSCASCHNPSLGWGDGLKLGRGFKMGELDRHTPTIINSAYNATQFWDGRAESLEHQATMPIESGVEMNLSMIEVLKRLEEIKGYQPMFDAAYPGEGVSKDTIGKALAAFQRTVVSRDSPFDEYLNGDSSAINQSAKRGFEVFRGKGNCEVCHSGPNFTDDGFHNIGIKGSKDPGRFKIVPIKITKGAFKTPTLRDVARTAPYLHNGMYSTLMEVVEHYDRGGDTKENLDPNMKPLGLTQQEKADLVEFMRSLSGTPVTVETPVLPN